jgi:hypothetical protein
MKKCRNLTEPELAIKWPLSRVETCLDAGEKKLLVSLIQCRYKERFLDPIRTLRSEKGHARGYGFAIMALCSLLIESLQSYRYGLPTTHEAEYASLAAFNPPAEYQIPKAERKSGTQVFADFFSFAAHQVLFLGVDGKTYHTSIRNGLLHQAQTKGGWKIKIDQTHLWNEPDKIVDRNRFADALALAFDQYLEELNRAAWDDDIWRKARRKLWWLVKLSA